MMKKKKGIVLILISLIIVAMVGIISYNLFKKEISTKQLQSGVTSTVNADTEVKNYTLTFIDRDSSRKVEISASSSKTIKSILEVAEQKFNDTYSDSFATYRKDGYKYEFSKNDDIIKRWSLNESNWVPITSAYVGGNHTFYAMYDKTTTTEKFNYKIDLIKDGGIGGPDALYIVKNTGKIYIDSSCGDEYEVVDSKVEIPKKEGYKFNGTSKGAIDSKGVLPVDYLINNGLRDIQESVIWTPIHTITLNKNQGSAGISELYIAEKTGIYYKKDCDDSSKIGNSVTGMPFRYGYTFDGYIVQGTNNNFLVINSDGTFKNDWKDKLINSTTNVALEALWTLNKYNITYNGIEDCMYSPNPATYTVETDTITLNNPTKSGYIFKGWTGSNGETPQTTVTIPKGSTGDKIYTANWEEKVYDLKVHFLLNEGTDGQQTLYRKKNVGFYKDADLKDILVQLQEKHMK